MSIGPGWRTDAAEPYACLATVAARSGAIPYLYRRIPLHLPRGLEAPDGAVAALRYREMGADGSVRGVLNCVIPATARAREAVARRFGIALEPETGGVIVVQGCVIDNSRENTCVLEPLVVTPEDDDDGPCDYDPNCIPGSGGGTGGGGTGGGETGGTGGGGSPCSNCGPNAPTMSCGPAVTRGSPVTCRVFNVGDLNVAGWSFSSGNVVVSGSGGRTEWSGPAVESGTVFVALMDGTHLYAFLTVTPRGWTWATKGVSEYRDGTGHPCLNHTPNMNPGNLPPSMAANGINLEIGWTNCDVGRRQIQPDSWDTGDGFTVTTAPSGPNQGMHYVRDATLYLRRESSYNSGLFPGAPPETLSDGWFGPQASTCGARANWYQFSTCMQANPDAYIAGAKAHEGRGTTGHNGHFSAAYDAASDPANDLMKLLDEQVGDPGEVVLTFLSRVRTRFTDRAKIIDDAAADGGPIVTGNWSGKYYGWTGQYFIYKMTSN